MGISVSKLGLRNCRIEVPEMVSVHVSFGDCIFFAQNFTTIYLAKLLKFRGGDWGYFVYMMRQRIG